MADTPITPKDYPSHSTIVLNNSDLMSQPTTNHMDNMEGIVIDISDGSITGIDFDKNHHSFTDPRDRSAIMETAQAIIRQAYHMRKTLKDLRAQLESI